MPVPTPDRPNLPGPASGNIGLGTGINSTNRPSELVDGVALPNDGGERYAPGISRYTLGQRLPVLDVEQAVGNPGQAHAATIEAQWDDFARRFRPVEQEVMDQVTSLDAINTSANRASDLITRQSEVNRGTIDRTLSRNNRSMDADARAAMERRISLTSGLDRITAENYTRESLKDRNTQVLQQLLGLGQGVSNQAMQQLGGAQMTRTARDTANANLSLQSRGQNMAFAGTLIGSAIGAGAS